MTTLVFIHPDGARTTCPGHVGDSVMYAALSHRLKGLLGECGGSLACATCHVIVDDAWAAKLAPMSELENEMLDATASERQPHSRLSCQIVVSEALDGLEMTLPAAQI